MRNRFAEAFADAAEADSRLMLLCADISPAGSMERFRTRHPERFLNVGVAEQAMIGMAAGLAMRGHRPFAYTIATFALYRPFEFVRVDLAYQNLDVTVVGMGAGVVYSTLGGTHHAQEDIGVASAIPNMKVLAPCDPSETEAATRWCAVENRGPTYLRLGKSGEPDLTSEAIDPFEFGKLRRITEGDDVAIVGYGPILRLGLELKSRFEAAGDSVSLVSCHTVKPLDLDGCRRLLERHRRVVVIEETGPTGGLGTALKALAHDIGATATVDAFGLQDAFIHCYGAPAELLAAHGLAVDPISERLGL